MHASGLATSDVSVQVLDASTAGALMALLEKGSMHFSLELLMAENAQPLSWWYEKEPRLCFFSIAQSCELEINFNRTNAFHDKTGFNRVKPDDSLLCACNFLPRPCLYLPPRYALRLLPIEPSRSAILLALHPPSKHVIYAGRAALYSSSHTRHPHTTPAQTLGARPLTSGRAPRWYGCRMQLPDGVHSRVLTMPLCSAPLPHCVDSSGLLLSPHADTLPVTAGIVVSPSGFYGFCSFCLRQ